MVTIELDVAHDEMPLEQVLQTIMDEVPSTQAVLVDVNGPTGWPVVKFTMDESALERFAEVYGADVDELRDLL